MNHLKKTLTTALLGITIASPTFAGNAGESGALFLRVGMGARAAGMGEAYTGVAKDATAMYWNPAAMAAVMSTKVALMHNEYFLSTRLEQGVVTHETDFGVVGLSFTGLYMDDMDRYDDFASPEPLGTFGAYDNSFAIGFARYVTPNVSVGITAKSVFQKIDDTSALGFAFDAGIFHVAKIDGMRLAAVVTNVGAPMKFDADDYALPRAVKVGGSYERDLKSLRGDLLFTLDLVFPNDGDMRQHIGAEYGYDRRFFLRAGYKGGYETQGATFGVGAAHRQFALDYAILLMRNDFDDSHRISLGLSL